MPKTATVKRTRRVSNPFDARLEVRLYSTELAKLRSEAEKREMSASDLVRSQLGELIRAEPPVRSANVNATRTPGRAGAGAQALTSGIETVDLAEVISELTGISWGHAMLKVRLGKVTLGGEPWVLSEAPADRLAEVAVEGELLPVDKPGGE